MATRRAVGIIRVSQTKGREGDSFASPGQQRERIEAACKREGLRLIAVHEELDVSGGTPLARREGLRTAIETVESGGAEVVMAAYFDRLIRSLDVQRELVNRVEAAGGEVFAVDAGQVTHGSATKKLNGTLLGAFAEYQRDTARERSGDAQRRAVARGVPPFARIPAGYERGPDGVLVPSAQAPVVTEAFRMRADGATVEQVRAYLADNGVRLSWHGVHAMLIKRTVLGEIHFGKLVNTDAHEAIVDAETWRRAQRTVTKGTRTVSSHLLARQNVLRCGSCGARMVISTQVQRGTAYCYYRCPPMNDCEKRAAIRAETAEEAVVERVRAALANVEGRASAEVHIRDAESDLAQKQDALSGAVAMLTGLEDVAGTRERLSELRRVRDDAQSRLDQLGGTRAAVSLSAGADWERLNLNEQRALIRATVERATVSPGRGAERVSVRLFTE